MINPDDYVYVPSVSSKAIRAKKDGSYMVIAEDEIRYTINTKGYMYDYALGAFIERPFAFLATPENKARLETVYGELEPAPVDEHLV